MNSRIALLLLATLTFVGLVAAGVYTDKLGIRAAAVPNATPTAQEPARFDFDTIRIIAEREVVENHGTYASTPVWSPDGSKIAFTKRPKWDTNPGWSPWGEVWIADGDGTNPGMIVENGAGVGWSRDSQWLYFSSTEPHEMGRDIATTDLYRIRPDGSDETFLFRDSANRGIYPTPCQLSDGRVAFYARPGRITFLDPVTRRTTSFLPDAPASLFWCSPGGHYIAYKADYKLWLGPSDGSSRQLLGSTSVDEIHPLSWTADGRSLVYAPLSEIWASAADGSSPKKVVDSSAFPGATDTPGPYFSHPFLSPDGRLVFVYFFPGLKDGSAVSKGGTYVVDVATGRVKVFAEGKMLIALSPNGSKGLLTYSWTGPDGWVRRPLSVVTIAP